MAGKSVDPKIQAARMASLCIVWGALAAVAYLGLISAVTDFLVSTGLWQRPTMDSGLRLLHLTTYKSFSTVVLIGIPVAIVAVIALGIAARVRPTLIAVPALLVAAAAVGLTGVALVFADVVLTASNGKEFIVALATIVVVAVLLRLQKFVRRFNQRAPGATSLLFAVVTIAYLIMSNGANISQIILSQIHVWLALIAFTIALISSARLVGAVQRMRRGK
ncbi:MAG TPA: hypothetical protein VF818_06975 [Ktedonobacterales bacterium]